MNSAAPARPRQVVRRSLAILAVGLLVLCALIALLLVFGEVGPLPFLTGFVLAVLPVPAYVALVLFVDRYEPEPRSMVLVALGWGASVAILVALVLNTFIEALIADFDPAAAEVYGGSISAPIVEEVAKGAVVLWFFWRRREEFDGIVDGVVYATMVGLGFAMVENILYYGQGALEEGIPGALDVFVARGLVAPFSHPLFTAIFGVGLGVASRTDSRTVVGTAVVLGLTGATSLHSAWNIGAGAGAFLAVYLLLMVPVFAAMLALIALGVRRDAAIVRRYLQPEVEAGLVEEEEIVSLGSVRARRGPRRSTGVAGREAHRTRREVQRAAAELAFLRQRSSRSGSSATPSGAEEAHYLALLRDLRDRRAAMG